VPTGVLPKGVVLAGEWLVDAAEWTRWGGELVAAVDGWAAEHPLLPGLPRRSAAGALGLPDPALVDPLVGALPDLVSDADGVHRRGVGARAPAQIERVLDGVLAHLGAEPFDAPEAAELSAAGLTEKHLAMATRAGRLIRVGPGVYLRPEAIDEAIARLASLAQPFTMSEARQALNTTRRVAVPLLEYLDRTHRTHRVDSQRRSLGP
jgi:selenocysteine-specific elongation factor